MTAKKFWSRYKYESFIAKRNVCTNNYFIICYFYSEMLNFFQFSNLKDIQEICYAIFKPNNFNIHIIINIYKKLKNSFKEYEKILKETKLNKLIKSAYSIARFLLKITRIKPDLSWSVIGRNFSLVLALVRRSGFVIRRPLMPKSYMVIRGWRSPIFWIRGKLSTSSTFSRKIYIGI